MISADDRATEIARGYGEPARPSKASLIWKIAAALRAAREEGRREGITEGWEEACHYIAVHRGQVGLAELMRSLSVKEKEDK